VLLVVLLDAAHQRSLCVDGAAVVGLAEVAAGPVATIEPSGFCAARLRDSSNRGAKPKNGGANQPG